MKSVRDYLIDSEELAGLADNPYLLEVEAAPLHRALVHLLRDLLEMMEQVAVGTGKVPPSLRAVGRSLRMLEPTLLEGFIEIPPEQIEAFIVGLMERFDKALKDARAQTEGRAELSA